MLARLLPPFFLDAWSLSMLFLEFKALCIIIDQAIGLMSRVFANGLGDLGSFPGRVIPKTQKMVLDTALLNTRHYKVRIEGKVEQSREWSSAHPTPRWSRALPTPRWKGYWKGVFRSPSTKVANFTYLHRHQFPCSVVHFVWVPTNIHFRRVLSILKYLIAFALNIPKYQWLSFKPSVLILPWFGYTLSFLVSFFRFFIFSMVHISILIFIPISGLHILIVCIMVSSSNSLYSNSLYNGF